MKRIEMSNNDSSHRDGNQSNEQTDEIRDLDAGLGNVIEVKGGVRR